MNKKIITASLAALALTGGAFSVSAEEMPVYSLDAIVVTANRTPEKQIDSNANVSVVTSKEIEQKHFNDVEQAIKNVPGVFITNHGAGSQSYNSDQVYINGSNKVVVLVDGMRKNTNGNTLMNSNISEMVAMDSIDHIEVLKGSASTLYGSDAQGGVINIITKKAKEDGVRTTLRTSFGNADKEKYTLYNEGKEGQVFWNVEAGKELQGDYKDGWGRKVINHLNAEHYNVKLGYDLGNDSDIIFNYEKYKADYTRPDYGSTSLQDNKGKKDNVSISLQYGAKINDRLSNQFSIYKNKTTFNDNYNNPNSQIGDTTNWVMAMKTTGISDQLTYHLNNQTITGGFDWYKDEISKFYNYNVFNYSIGQFVEPKQVPDGISVNNTAIYLQDKIDVNDKWNITPGVRFDHHSKFGNHTSPSLSIGYKQNENTNYYLNYKTFFVAPSLYQLYAPSYTDKKGIHQIGNPNLQPQEGNTIEFGINHQFDDSLSGTFNVFHTHAKNLIQAPNGYLFENTGKANVNGFSLNLNKKFSQHWNASIGYSFLHGTTQKDENINGDGNLPESTLNINVGYQADKFNANLSGRGIMNRYGTKAKFDYSNKPITISDYANYWVWDLAANYQFTKEATLFARVNNIFDQFYTDVGTSYNPTTTWYSAQGRNFEVGLQFQF